MKHSTEPDHEWYQQQHNMATGNCCGLGDAHVLESDEWKNTTDHYEVKIKDNWYVVPKINMRDIGGDPTKREPLKGLPNPSGKAVVWYKFPNEIGQEGTKPTIYCFSPWETMQ